MARINTYDPDGSLTGTDKLLGIDSGGATNTYTLSALSSYFNIEAGGNPNYYLDGVTKSGNTLTFSVNGTTNQTYTFGSAAFSETTDFASASHTHTLTDIVKANAITTAQLNVAGTGTDGQILASTGTGGFKWITSTASTDTNFYLSDITRSGETLTFVINGASDQEFTFGESAFLSVASLTDRVKTAINVDDLADLGALASLDTIGQSQIENNAVTTDKVNDDAITERKLSISNSPTDGYLLSTDADGTLSWVASSSSNYHLNTVSKNADGVTIEFNLTGGYSGTTPSYTFGNAAFATIGTAAGDVAEGDHSHTMASITNAGSLATENSVGTSLINDSSITIDKLSPAAGSNGQFLTVTNGELAWTTIQTTSTDFLTLPSTPSSFSGQAGKILEVNSDADAIVFADLSIAKTDIDTTNSGVAGLILGIDSNGDLEWTTKSSAGVGSVLPTNLKGLSDNGTAGQLIQTDGDSTFSYITTLPLTAIPEITTAKIAADAITGAKIADDAINSEHYTDLSIDTAHLSADAVTGAKIADDAVDSEHIADGAIDTIHIGANQVTNAKIADDAVRARHLNDDAVETAAIKDNAVTNDKLADNSVDSDQYVDASIDEEHLNIVNTATDGQILSWSNSDSKFKWIDNDEGDITSIVAGTGLTGTSLDSGDATLNVIGGDGITANADEIEVTVDDTTIELSATDGTGSVRIKDGGVTNSKLGALAVSEAKLAGDSVSAAKLKADSVETAKIKNDAVTNDKLAANAVDTDQIADDSILAIHLNTATAATDTQIPSYDAGTGGFTWIDASDAGTDYLLPAASNSALGGVKLKTDTEQTVAPAAVTSTALRSYAVQFNSNEELVVNVPWVNTTYTVGDGGLTQKNFTTALNTKLTGIEALADVTDATNVTSSLVSATSISSGDKTTIQSNLGVDAAGTDNSTDVTLATVTDNYLTISGQEITAGTVPVALGGTGATTASAARTALGVDAAGTDNSTDVTLANTNYLSISGQEITGGTVPVSSGGTGATTAAAARTALGVDAAGTDNSTDVTLAGSYDYLTISGQTITRNQIDLTTDVTGTLPVGNMAATALTTVQTAASESAQLALTTQEGDVVVRSDENKTYMHNGGEAGTMADFTLLATPTDAVTSVAGKNGVVNLVPADVGLGNVTNESKATMFASPTFTGTVSGVTATHVGLGNVTNESKTTMFAAPAFTGDATFDTDTLAIDSTNDRVGIGTTSPATTLEVSVVGTGNSINGQVLAETQGANGNAGYGFRTNGTTRWNISTIGTDGSNNLRFYDVNNSAERMRIDSSGRVGIGTNSIAANLHIRDTGSTSSIFLDSTATTDQQNRIASLRSSGGAYSSLLIDANTHIFRTGTTERMRITSGGQISATGAGTAAAPSIIVAGDSDTGWYRPAANTIGFSTAGTERMRIDSSGNVGIGTTSPNTALEIHGNLNIGDGTSVTSIGLQRNSANYLTATDAAGYLVFRTGGANERMRITSGGNVLIGSGSALDTATRLQVSGNSSGVTSFNGAADDVIIEHNTHVGITLATPNTALATLAFADPQSTAAGYLRYDHSDDHLEISVNGSERMRIDSSGNVGIGTTTTTAGKLSVIDSGSGGTATHIASGTTSSQIRFKAHTYLYNGIMSLYDSGGTEDVKITAANGADSWINNGGNVGINTTSPSALLEIQTTGTSGSQDFQIFSRGVSPNYEVFKISRAAGSTELLANQNLTLSADYDSNHTGVDSNVIFKTDNSERMRIDSSGQVGIGTNSPAQALHVAGDIGVDANIIHNGDTNTYINFGSDSMNFYAGNQKMITLSEGVTDEVVINQGSADIDFRVESNNKTKALFVNGETDHVQASVGVESNAGTGNMTLDAEKYGIFKLTGNITTSTLTINNMQEGQVIDILLSGTLTSASITLSSDGTGRTFNNVGGGTLDTSKANHIQVVCIDDTAASKIFNYSIGTYESDNQP